MPPSIKPLESYERFVHLKTIDFQKALKTLLPEADSFLLEWSETWYDEEYRHFENERELQAIFYWKTTKTGISVKVQYFNKQGYGETDQRNDELLEPLKPIDQFLGISDVVTHRYKDRKPFELLSILCDAETIDKQTGLPKADIAFHLIAYNIL